MSEGEMGPVGMEDQGGGDFDTPPALRGQTGYHQPLPDQEDDAAAAVTAAQKLRAMGKVHGPVDEATQQKIMQFMQPKPPLIKRFFGGLRKFFSFGRGPK